MLHVWLVAVILRRIEQLLGSVAPDRQVIYTSDQAFKHMRTVQLHARLRMRVVWPKTYTSDDNQYMHILQTRRYYSLHIRLLIWRHTIRICKLHFCVARHILFTHLLAVGEYVIDLKLRVMYTALTIQRTYPETNYVSYRKGFHLQWECRQWLFLGQIRKSTSDPTTERCIYVVWWNKKDNQARTLMSAYAPFIPTVIYVN